MRNHHFFVVLHDFQQRTVRFKHFLMVAAALEGCSGLDGLGHFAVESGLVGRWVFGLGESVVGGVDGGPQKVDVMDSFFQPPDAEVDLALFVGVGFPQLAPFLLLQGDLRAGRSLFLAPGRGGFTLCHIMHYIPL
jgi:hypothetical protein